MADPVKMEIEDFCCIANATVSLQHRGLELITGENKDTTAADNNGAGKTTISKALCWGLYGETVDGDRYDEVIRYGAKQARVVVYLDAADNLWRITRKRSKGKPELQLEYKMDAGWPEWVGNAKEIQARIDELMRRDFTAFCHTTLFGQGDVNRFYSAGNARQHETLNKIMRSEKYRRGEQRLRDKEVKAANAKVGELTLKVAGIESRLGEYDLTALQLRSNEWLAEQNETRDQLLATVDTLIAGAKRSSTAAAKLLAEYNKSISAKRTQLKESVADELFEARRQRDQVNEDRTGALQLLATLRTKLQGVTDQLAELKGERCPTCTTPLNKGAAAKHVKELRAKAERLGKARDEQHDKLNEMDKRRDRLAQQCERLAAEIEAQREIQDGIAQLERERDRAVAEQRRAAEQQRQQAEGHLERIKQMDTESNPHEQRLVEAKARIGELRAELKERKAELNEQRKLQAHYEFWVRGFGLRGLPSMLLDSAMPYLTQRANEYLQVLSDGDITVEISTQRELKQKGATRDEITITATIEGVPNAKPSNGQRRKLEIATDLALVDLAATREAGSELLLMDEVLDGLDSVGRSLVLELLRGLRSERSSILVITQEPELAPAFERQLHVVKHGMASTVTEVK
jgi:DNA repair exonuclease SbcCD ATPase subunit